MTNDSAKIAEQQLSDGEMLKNIMEDIRHIRELLEANNDDHQSIRDAISKIREENAGEKVKLRNMLGGISVFVAGAVAWIVSHLSK
jgi:chromosome segregation and condensation protein ScpB